LGFSSDEIGKKKAAENKNSQIRKPVRCEKWVGTRRAQLFQRVFIRKPRKKSAGNDYMKGGSMPESRAGLGAVSNTARGGVTFQLKGKGGCSEGKINRSTMCQNFRESGMREGLANNRDLLRGFGGGERRDRGSVQTWRKRERGEMVN